MNGRMRRRLERNKFIAYSEFASKFADYSDFLVVYPYIVKDLRN